MSAPADVLPVVARLYYTGVGSRRYKRASVHTGPGEPLCFKSIAEEAIKRARAEERAAVAELIERDKAQREALETCQRWFAAHSPTAPLITGGSAEHPMVTMLNEVLSRVGGRP